MINLVFTIQIFIIALIAYVVVTSWTEVITRWLIKRYNWDKEQISTWVKIGLISLIALIITITVYNIEIHDLLGISETVDTELTGTYEKFQNGQIQHYKY
jgi:hypothetical protein